MQHMAAIIQQPAAPARPVTKKEVRAGAVMFLLGLGLCVVVLVVSLLLLRTRIRARLAGGARLARGGEGGVRSTIDPWAESGRRLEVEPDDHDTVDIDPNDLRPDDIEPRDPPRNGGGPSRR